LTSPVDFGMKKRFGQPGIVRTQDVLPRPDKGGKRLGVRGDGKKIFF
jgi:hypothetical protein